MEEPLDLEFGFLERYARIPTVPRLSIVIPCLVCDKRFENTLASVLQNRPDSCEVLVTVAGSYDDPYELGNEVGFVEASADASLLELINLGVAHAGGEVVHVLQCGLEVCEGWTDEPLRRFDDESIAAVSPWIVAEHSSSGRATVGVGYGSGGKRRECQLPLTRRVDACRHVLGPTLRAAFYRRELFWPWGDLTLASAGNSPISIWPCRCALPDTKPRVNRRAASARARRPFNPPIRSTEAVGPSSCSGNTPPTRDGSVR